MFELMGKKIITILHWKILLNWTYVKHFSCTQQGLIGHQGGFLTSCFRKYFHRISQLISHLLKGSLEQAHYLVE